MNVDCVVQIISEKGFVFTEVEAIHELIFEVSYARKEFRSQLRRSLPYIVQPGM